MTAREEEETMMSTVNLSTPADGIGESYVLDGKVIGARLKGWRLIRGIELPDLSRRTCISEDTLKIYERGRRVPGGLRMLVIMDALQLGPADLLHKTEV